MKSWLERAEIIPGRSNTRSKASGRMYPIGAGPCFQVQADGAHLMGEDRKWYLDMGCALGAVSLGHRRALRRFQVGSLPYTVEIEAAEAVLEKVAPWASRVRFVRTGSEAMSGALMVAQRATGRKYYWRLRGSYHGWHEPWSLEAAEAADALFFDVNMIPELIVGAAAIIIEPPRWQKFTGDWLQAVVEAAHNEGALVIFDEMIYGGRWALGGATEYFGIKPDLACFGKALGNGAPIGMIVGNDALAEHGELISGTFSGDASALGSLVDTLKEYQERNVIDWMWERGRQLQDGLAAEIAESGVDAKTEGAPVHQRIGFEDEALGLLFSGEMAKRSSIIFPPYAANIMRAHSEEDIERVIKAAGESLRALAERGERAE